MTCLSDMPAFVATKFTCVATLFLTFAILFVATINVYVATLFQCVFIDFSLILSRLNVECLDKVFLLLALFFVMTGLTNVVIIFFSSMHGFVVTFISMSRQNYSAPLGALLVQSCDRVKECRDNNFAFKLPLCCDIHFCVATFFLYFISYYVVAEL